jgi:hypothetical protein
MSTSLDANFESQTQLIPWKWHIRPDSGIPQCHPPRSTLITFGALNMIMAFFSPLFGHRTVIQALSFGHCGRSDNAWKVTWIVPLGTQLAANAIIARLYQKTPDYGQGFTIAELTLFYTVRPRLGWILSTLAMWHTERVNKHAYWYKDSLPWTNSARSLLISEAILVCLGTVYMGITAHFMANSELLHSGRDLGANGRWANIMYASSIAYLVGSVFALAMFVYLVKFASKATVHRAPLFSLLGLVPFVASWCFWTGYLFLAGDL